MADFPALDQRTVYKVKYDKQTLILKAQSSYSMYVDLADAAVTVQLTGWNIPR